MSLEGPKGPNLVCQWLVQLGGSHPYHVLWPLKRPLRHSWGPQTGLFWPQNALLGAPEVLGGPNCHRLVNLGWTHGHHTLWPGIGSLLGLGGSKRARFGPKCPLLDQIGPLAATKRPNINPMCVVTISPTHADQSAAVENKSGPPMTFGVSKKGSLSQKVPFLVPRQGPIAGQSVL